MVKVARITAIVLIVIGVMVVLIGFGLGIGSMFTMGMGMRQALRNVGPGTQMVRFGGVGMGLAVMAVAFVQGLLMAAYGEGLYLLSKVAEHMPKPAAVVVSNAEPTPVTPQ